MKLPQLIRFATLLLIPGVAICAVAAEPPSLQPLEIRVVPLGPTEEQSSAWLKEILEREDVRRALGHDRYRVLSSDFDALNDPAAEAGAEKPKQYEIRIYNYTRNRLLKVTGEVSDLTVGKIESSEEAQTPPSEEEFEDAVHLLQRDPRFSAGLAMGLLQPYSAMPPTLDPSWSGDDPADRIIPVGLKPLDSQAQHEIVGVNLSRETIRRYPNMAPPTSVATAAVCGPPSAGQASSPKGLSGSARLDVARGGETIWRITVLRPSASSGSKGSAIELRDVFYKNHLFLRRAHIPILNVNYDGGACGPYRDWAYGENPFRATGTTLASGILRASSPPSTVLDSGSDRGNFKGVAVWESGGDLILTSELAAGWYRYVSEYRFSDDGTIRPLFKLGAVDNSCVCHTHNHHIYWRFDFDIDGGSNNSVATKTASGWSPTSAETKQQRDSSHQGWRFTNTETGFAYDVTPGPRDGTASFSSYGRGDVWVLKYKSNEIDDSTVRTGTRAALDRFVTGESLTGTDSVLWYAAHFRHVHNDLAEADSETGLVPDSIVGPVLRPSAR